MTLIALCEYICMVCKCIYFMTEVNVDKVYEKAKQMTEEKNFYMHAVYVDMQIKMELAFQFMWKWFNHAILRVHVVFPHTRKRYFPAMKMFTKFIVSFGIDKNCLQSGFKWPISIGNEPVYMFMYGYFFAFITNSTRSGRSLVPATFHVTQVKSSNSVLDLCVVVIVVAVIQSAQHTIWTQHVRYWVGPLN